MATMELNADINWTSSFETAASLIKQLGNAYVELEAHPGAVEGNIQWDEVEKHFRNLQSICKKKFEELERKEKDFIDRDSKVNKMLAEKEASVTTKEQGLLDWIQELKDAAVAAITEVGAAHSSEAAEHVGVIDSNGNKVSSSRDDEFPPHGNVPKSTNEGAVEVNPRPELTQICKQMDAKRLLQFIENQKDFASLSKELSLALNNANDPGRMVLDSLGGFFPNDGATQQGDNGNTALLGMRKSCLIIMEALATLMAKADTAAEFFLNPETKQCAKALANKWRPKVAAEGTDVANGKSLEVEGFLRLLATFRIASEFDEEELCMLVLAVAGNRQAPELCRSLGLIQKMPDIVQALIDHGKQVDAVHFIQAFQLSESFPPVPLLKMFLKHVRRNSQVKDGGASAPDYNALELAALKAVIACVAEYHLENDYSLDTLHIRVAQLEKPKTAKKRDRETVHKQQKNPCPSGASHGSRPRGGGRTAGGRGRVRKSIPSHLPPRDVYPHAGPSSYNFQTSTRPAYLPEANAQISYYYPQDDRLTTQSHDVGPPAYGSYVGDGIRPSHQPYF